MRTDWLPARRDLQLAMAKNWHKAIEANAVKWKIPATAAFPMQAIIEKAEEVLNKAKSGERTPVNTAECKEIFAALLLMMRDIKKRYLFMPPLSRGDFALLDLKEPDTAPTAIPPPTAQVEADLTFPGIHLVELKRIRAVAGVEPDRRSDYGVRIFWGLGGEANKADKFRVTEAPGSGNDLPHSKFTRRHKERFDFDGESGNAIYFCLRYENPKGQAGPFGPILKAVIP
jgi:hypothetical protein